MAQHRGGGRAAHRLDLARRARAASACAPVRVAIGHHHDLHAELRDVGPGEAVAERDREHAVPALERLHPGDEALGRLARRVDGRDHPAVEHRRHRPDLAARRAQREVDQLLGALVGVGVGILLVEHQEIGRLDHRGGQMAVRGRAPRRPRCPGRPAPAPGRAGRPRSRRSRRRPSRRAARAARPRPAAPPAAAPAAGRAASPRRGAWSARPARRRPRALRSR